MRLWQVTGSPPAAETLTAVQPCVICRASGVSCCTRGAHRYHTLPFLIHALTHIYSSVHVVTTLWSHSRLWNIRSDHLMLRLEACGVSLELCLLHVSVHEYFTQCRISQGVNFKGRLCRWTANKVQVITSNRSSQSWGTSGYLLRACQKWLMSVWMSVWMVSNIERNGPGEFDVWKRGFCERQKALREMTLLFRQTNIYIWRKKVHAI